MKNLKQLLESYINDNLSAPEREQLNHTFDEAADYDNFRATFSPRIAQQRRLIRLRKMLLYGGFIALTLLSIAFFVKIKNDKAHEKPPMRKDIAMVETPMTTDDNFDKAYRQTLTNVRKDVKVTDADWKTAYNEGHFAEAAKLIERAGTPASPEATYCLAISFIQQKQFDKAVSPLKRLTDSDPQQLKTFTPEARWLLANVYLKLNRLADAKLLLQQFVNENATHADEAKVLLNNDK